MELNVLKPNEWQRTLDVSVPAYRVEDEIDELSANYSKEIKLKGFRKGKVPKEIVKMKYASSLETEAINRLVPKIYQEIIKEKKFQPITTAKIHDLSFKPKKRLHFKASFEIIPDIELKDYKNLRFTKRVDKIGRKEIKSVLHKLREENAVYNPVNRPICVGDLVTVDIEVIKDGHADENDKKENVNLVVKEKKLTKDMFEKFLAKGVNDEFEIESKDSKTKVRIKEIKEPSFPQMDDKFAKDLGFENLKALKRELKMNLIKEDEKIAGKELERDISEYLLAQNAFEPPDSLVELYLSEMRKGKEGDVSSLKAEMRPAAIRAVKLHVILDKIAEREEIVATDDEVDRQINDFSSAEKKDSKFVKLQLKKSGRYENLKEQIRRNKTFDFLIANSKIKIKKVRRNLWD